MYVTDAERSLQQETGFDETEFEFSAYVRPQFKDANDFGRACRALATAREDWSEACNDLTPGNQEKRILHSCKS